MEMEEVAGVEDSSLGIPEKYGGSWVGGKRVSSSPSVPYRTALLDPSL